MQAREFIFFVAFFYSSVYLCRGLMYAEGCKRLQLGAVLVSCARPDSYSEIGISIACPCCCSLVSLLARLSRRSFQL